MNLAHEIDHEMTAKELAKRERVSVRAIGIPYAKLRAQGHPLFASQFDCNASLSQAQIEILRPGKLTTKTKPKVQIPTAAVTETAQHSMSLEAGPVNVSAPQKVPTIRRWPLWAAMIITAGASVPNMVEVTTAMKGSGLVAWSLTACFTFVPFLLIMARVGGWAWPVVIGVMGYTAFCNTAAIFGGLTALDSGYILKPTVFLEAVTNLLNTDYMGTARALALLMSLLIGCIEFVAFKNLAK